MPQFIIVSKSGTVVYPFPSGECAYDALEAVADPSGAPLPGSAVTMLEDGFVAVFVDDALELKKKTVVGHGHSAYDLELPEPRRPLAPGYALSYAGEIQDLRFRRMAHTAVATYGRKVVRKAPAKPITGRLGKDPAAA